MTRLNHPHPGTTIQTDVIDCLGLSVEHAAERFGIPLRALAGALNGQLAISPVLAQGLEQAGFSTARFWLALQAEYDRAQS